MKASVNTSLTSNVVVGCEIEVTYNPELDEATFENLIGTEVQTIVRRQPSISELVNRARKTSAVTAHDGQVGGMSELFNT